MKFAIEVGDRKGERIAYGNLSVAYQSLGDYRKSTEYIEKHLKSVIGVDKEGLREISVLLMSHWVTIEKPLSTIKMFENCNRNWRSEWRRKNV